jgi:GntR family transcriptional repressor for pyruvate dehydrogenase complex
MKPIDRMPIVQQVAENLRQEIISGAFKEGDKLPTEGELCKQLSIGRSTLREAYQILQVQGFVDIRPGKGAFAGRGREIGLDKVVEWFVEHEVELIDFIEVRMAIEPLAARFAAQRATPSDIKQLEQIHQACLNAINQKDTAQITLVDEQFHNAIMKITRNKLLISINEIVSAYFKDFRNRTFRVPENIDNVIEPHTSILEAIVRKDCDEAEQQMKLHIEYIRRDLTNITGRI